MKKVKLSVEGMHCGGCTEIVRHLLEQEAGVRGCSVSLEDRQVRVAIDPERVTAGKLADVLTRAGYTAAVQAE
jgi:copper chaperone CopZ